MRVVDEPPEDGQLLETAYEAQESYPQLPWSRDKGCRADDLTSLMARREQSWK
jgi:hypothetical protein